MQSFDYGGVWQAPKLSLVPEDSLSLGQKCHISFCTS